MISDSRLFTEGLVSRMGSPFSRASASTPLTFSRAIRDRSASDTARRNRRSRPSMCCTTCMHLRTMQAIRRNRCGSFTPLA